MDDQGQMPGGGQQPPAWTPPASPQGGPVAPPAPEPVVPPVGPSVPPAPEPVPPAPVGDSGMGQDPVGQ